MGTFINYYINYISSILVQGDIRGQQQKGVGGGTQFISSGTRLKPLMVKYKSLWILDLLGLILVRV